MVCVHMWPSLDISVEFIFYIFSIHLYISVPLTHTTCWYVHSLECEQDPPLDCRLCGLQPEETWLLAQTLVDRFSAWSLDYQKANGCHYDMDAVAIQSEESHMAVAMHTVNQGRVPTEDEEACARECNCNIGTKNAYCIQDIVTMALNLCVMHSLGMHTSHYLLKWLHLLQSATGHRYAMSFTFFFTFVRVYTILTNVVVSVI